MLLSCNPCLVLVQADAYDTSVLSMIRQSSQLQKLASFERCKLLHYR